MAYTLIDWPRELWHWPQLIECNGTLIVICFHGTILANPVAESAHWNGTRGAIVRLRIRHGLTECVAVRVIVKNQLSLTGFGGVDIL